jgi:hypothetical protein
MIVYIIIFFAGLCLLIFGLNQRLLPMWALGIFFVLFGFAGVYMEHLGYHIPMWLIAVISTGLIILTPVVGFIQRINRKR